MNLSVSLKQKLAMSFGLAAMVVAGFSSEAMPLLLVSGHVPTNARIALARDICPEYKGIVESMGNSSRCNFATGTSNEALAGKWKSFSLPSPFHLYYSPLDLSELLSNGDADAAKKNAESASPRAISFEIDRKMLSQSSRTPTYLFLGRGFSNTVICFMDECHATPLDIIPSEDSPFRRLPDLDSIDAYHRDHSPVARSDFLTVTIVVENDESARFGNIESLAGASIYDEDGYKNLKQLFFLFRECRMALICILGLIAAAFSFAWILEERAPHQSTKILSLSTYELDRLEGLFERRVFPWRMMGMFLMMMAYFSVHSGSPYPDSLAFTLSSMCMLFPTAVRIFTLNDKLDLIQRSRNARKLAA